MPKFRGLVIEVITDDRGNMVKYFDENLGEDRTGKTVYKGCRLQPDDILELDKRRRRGILNGIICFAVCLSCEGYSKKNWKAVIW